MLINSMNTPRAVCALFALVGPLLLASDAPGERRIPTGPPQVSGKSVVLDRSTTIGNLGLRLTNLGWFGNLLSQTVSQPSCEWPLNSNVEHMYLGGVWVGGISTEGEVLVSAGAEDTGSGQASPKQEFGPRLTDTVVSLSSNPLSPNFSTRALADQHFEMVYDDFNTSGGGSPQDPHIPMGVRVYATALAYAPSYADDFVILRFEVENISGQELTDVFVGFYAELTVGNTTVTIPQGTPSWNFYDDLNGFVGPGELPDDPDIRLMHCHDNDGEEGKAVSWVGVRLLGTDAPEEIFSYRQWRFGSIPRFDVDKYAYMSSGQIDQGVAQDGTNFDVAGNWISMFAAGPWPTLFPDDRATFTMAIVAGRDSTDMVLNSQIAQSTFDQGFKLPAGPPSPVLEISTVDNAVILEWDPGTNTLEGQQYDPTTASPEFHRSEFTNEYDFQGYRIYRILGDTIDEDPFTQASLVAEFDRTEWPDGRPDNIGFNVGLPPMENGKRRFVDRGVLNGFSYYYAVTSYASANPRLELPMLESGFNENATVVTPGSAPGGGGSTARVGVYPNPYRGSSRFDGRLPGGEPSELGRNIYFTNVPRRATISIYNLSGARVDSIERDDATTGQVAWNMLSENTRPIASGLYVFVVEDLETGETQRGKLVILK